MSLGGGQEINLSGTKPVALAVCKGIHRERETFWIIIFLALKAVPNVFLCNPFPVVSILIFVVSIDTVGLLLPLKCHCIICIVLYLYY